MYGERIGAVSVVTSSREEASRVASQVHRWTVGGSAAVIMEHVACCMKKMEYAAVQYMIYPWCM